MAQIKYVVFGCLIFVTAFIAVTAFEKISSVEFITKTEPVQGLCGNADEPNSKGRILFKANCGSCHALDKILSGPALRGVMTRGPWVENKENFRKWVRNPAKFVPTTRYTKDLHKIYGQIMPSFSSTQITDEELEMIHQYLSL